MKEICNHQKPTKISIKIIALDHGWSMGDDLCIQVFPDITAGILIGMIHARKPNLQINTTKLSIMQNSTQFDIKKNWNTSLKKCGITHNTIIKLEPRASIKFQWHPKEYYELCMIKKIIEVLSSHEEKELTKLTNFEETEGICINALEQLVRPFPPPLNDIKFIPFIRSYPEKFYVETSLSNGSMKVWLNKDLSLPLWI